MSGITGPLSCSVAAPEDAGGESGRSESAAESEVIGRESSNGPQRQFDPQQPVPVFGCDVFRIYIGGQIEYALEWTVVDFQGQHVDGRCLVAGGLGNLTCPADHEAARLSANIEGGFLHAGELDTNHEVIPAPESVERGLPASWHTEVEKLSVRHLHCDFPDVALDLIQIAKRAFHDQHPKRRSSGGYADIGLTSWLRRTKSGFG